MSNDTRRVWYYNGRPVTFHPNKGTSERGFIYVGGRRLYVAVHHSVLSSFPVFVAHTDTASTQSV